MLDHEEEPGTDKAPGNGPPGGRVVGLAVRDAVGAQHVTGNSDTQVDTESPEDAMPGEHERAKLGEDRVDIDVEHRVEALRTAGQQDSRTADSAGTSEGSGSI